MEIAHDSKIRTVNTLECLDIVGYMVITFSGKSLGILNVGENAKKSGNFFLSGKFV